MIKPSLLLVEDSQPVAERLAASLERRYGATVVRVADLEAARGAVARQHFDLAVVDHFLPDGDGLSLLRNWPASEEHALPPFVGMSSMPTNSMVADYLRGQSDRVAFWDKTTGLDPLHTCCDRFLQPLGDASAKETCLPFLDGAEPLDGRRLGGWLRQQLREHAMRPSDMDIYVDEPLARSTDPIPQVFATFLQNLAGVLGKACRGRTLFVFLTLKEAADLTLPRRILLTFRFDGLDCPLDAALQADPWLKQRLGAAFKAGLSLDCRIDPKGVVRQLLVMPVGDGHEASGAAAAG